MGYRHIDNLYRNQSIFLFKECYALEKIHGTSAHIKWSESEGGKITFFAGGENYTNFCALFNYAHLLENFKALGHPDVTVYGEAYGGKQQKQSWRYGKDLRFVAFEVQIGDTWLEVPAASDVVSKLGLEFVHYKKILADLVSVDAERDAPSEQAKRNGVEGDQPREGVVLRPLVEVVRNDGERFIVKHKRDEERETRTPRKVDASVQVVLDKATDIANEWVTATRLQHVLDKLGNVNIENMKDVIEAVVEDVTREASGEIVDSKEARKAIGTATARLFKKHLNQLLQTDK
jgi:hypothetical protein